MKRLFKKIASLFSVASLFFALALSTEAMEFNCWIVSDKMPCEQHITEIITDVDERLSRGMYHRGGRMYGVQDWFLIWTNLVIESLPSHINFGAIKRVIFRTETPLEISYDFASREPWEVYVVDHGATVVVVCRSLEDVRKMDEPLLTANNQDDRFKCIKSLMQRFVEGYGHSTALDGGES